MELFKTIEANEEKYLDFLCRICAFEARAIHKDTLDAMADYIATFAEAEGFQVTRSPMELCGDFLTIDINEGAPKGCMFLNHMDTVHEKGTFGEDPVHICEDRIVAPGVIDCKSGIAVALLCMKALLENNVQKHIRLILTSDEEITNRLGGEKEVRFIQQSAAGFPYAINCEPAEGNYAVVARKGILTYRLDIQGVGGHSGKHYFTCKNAILEAAHKIVALHGKSVPGGTSYSCNIIQAGNVVNVIPDQCTLSLDIRAVTVADLEIAKQTVEQIAQTAFVPGTTCRATLLTCRPPMEKQPQTLELLDRINAVCQRHGFETLTPSESGGGSDSCYTQAAGITSLCGMGGIGGSIHTTEEFLIKDSVALRAKILASFLQE